MDIEFETSLWTRISSLLEKNNTKNTVSRNEPFSGHFFSFFNTCQSCVLSIRSPVGYHYRQKKNKQLHAPKPPNRQPITIKRLPGNPERTASIPIHLADFKEMAARNFSTGKKCLLPNGDQESFSPFRTEDTRKCHLCLSVGGLL